MIETNLTTSSRVNFIFRVRCLAQVLLCDWLIPLYIHFRFPEWFISRRRFSYRWSRDGHRTKPTRWPQLKWKEQTISKKANLVVKQGQYWTNKRSAKRLTWSLNRFSTEWIGTRPICLSYEHLITATRMHSCKMRTVRCSGRRGRGCLSRGRVSTQWGSAQGGVQPPWTEWLTVVKTLPFRNFVCGW